MNERGPTNGDWTSGLDAVRVLGRRGRLWSLELVFVPVSAGSEGVIPPDIGPENLRVLDVKGVPVADLRVVEVRYPSTPGAVALPVVLQDDRDGGVFLQEGDAPVHSLVLLNVEHVAPGQDRAGFVLEVGAPAEVDCQVAQETLEAELPPGPLIDYRARDYEALRRLMTDQLALLMPGWSDSSPADLMVALVETLAYSADHVSYYQDAVATESYLDTARKRISVRRHARLADYRLSEGCNARAWVALQVAGLLRLPQGTPLVTRVPGVGTTVIAPTDTETLDKMLRLGAQVFETVAAVDLSPLRNRLNFAVPDGEVPYVLPRGTTSAELAITGCGLQAGDVVVFQEVKNAATGREEDADPERRQAVRLTRVTPGGYVPYRRTPQGPEELAPTTTVIEWAPEDALPFPLWVVSLVDGREVQQASVVWGNVVLADHGRSVADEPLLPEQVPRQAPYRPTLKERNLTYRVPLREAATRPATLAVKQDPQDARPQVQLRQTGATLWSPVFDLLESGAYDRAFVVENDEQRAVHLRFGDGVLGRPPTPGSTLLASYRVGNGVQGNVGAGALQHVVTTLTGIQSLTNPLAAQGGQDPEPLSRARLGVPQAYKVQQRAVTTDDWTTIAERHPAVQKAAARALWTGSWLTFAVAVDRYGGEPMDAAFRAEMTAYLERFRQAGTALEVQDPVPAPVEIALVAYVRPEYGPNAVRDALQEAFNDGLGADGQPGFFNPDNFTFGQPVYLSRVLAAAAAVPGVAWVDADPRSDPRVRFQRWGRPAAGELQAGEIPVGALEIVRAASDPTAPEKGTVTFYVVRES